MLKKQGLRIASLLCILFTSLTFLSSAIAEPIIIRFSHVVAEDTPKGQGAILFKELVEKRLAEKVKVEIYPRSIKYTDDQVLLAMLFGDVQMAAPSFTKFRRFSRAIQVFDLPFLFENAEEVHRFQQSATGQRLLSSMEDKGIKGLAYWDNGMRVLAADRPIRKPDDVEGLRFRIEPSLILQKQYATLGAIATPMPFKYLPDALRVGLVDGYENAWSNILPDNLQAQRPYITTLNESYLGYMVVTSKAFWDKLPNDIRQELTSILTEVSDTVLEIAKAKEMKARQQIEQTPNVTVINLDPATREEWRSTLTPLWNEFESEIGPEIMEAAKNAKEAK